MTGSRPSIRTALVVVDMQNGFIAPSAGAGVPGAERAVAAVSNWIDYAAARGWPVLLTRDVNPFGGTGSSAEHDAALHPSVTSRGTVVDKGPGSAGGFSGFSAIPTATGAPPSTGGLSGLAEQLRTADINELVVIGVAADVCVAATARDARRLGYHVTVDLNATAFVGAHPGGKAAVIEELRGCGVEIEGRQPE
ncbi:isochorismatase family cysteine hydrolase [Nesterenkonia sp.]|uniref:cysteine hydrolase family protein n=1 Tax=Nesterenkonia sp. TaxID=704201 RepID=UPI0026257281|nr:isochorismatase family cysteine hydrolase [Nesterenkonia sp.]